MCFLFGENKNGKFWKFPKTVVLYVYYYVDDLNGSFSFHHYIFLFVPKILPKSSTFLLELRLVFLGPSPCVEKPISHVLSPGPGGEWQKSSLVVMTMPPEWVFKLSFHKDI